MALALALALALTPTLALTLGAISLYDTSELMPPPSPLAEGGGGGGWRGGDGVTCLALLNGHTQPVRELQWRPAEAMLSVRCAMDATSVGRAAHLSGVSPPPAPTNGQLAPIGFKDVAADSTVFVWQLPAGRLARVLCGEEAQLHLQQMVSVSISPLATCHLPLATCHLPLATCHLPLATDH